MGIGKHLTAAGLFAKLFKYTMEKDKYLADITSHIPQNAKYTSKTIQNEVIEILASMVLKKIKQKYDTADSAAFCLKSDGTRDRRNIENVSVVIRFVCNGVPEEHLIGLLELQQLNADYITTEICHFFEVGKFLIHLLAILKPANAILQSQHVNLCSAAEVVQGCVGALRNLRENDSELQQYCTGMTTVEPSPKRLRTVNPSYADSVIFSTLGQEGQSGSERATEALRRQMLNILDTAVSEMENRFSTKNLELMKALSCLMPKSNKFLDIQLLEPLCGLAGVAKK